MSGGVEDARAVEVCAEVAFAGLVPDFFQNRERGTDAAAHVVRVLQREQCSVGAEAPTRVDKGRNSIPGQDGVRRCDGPKLAAGECGCCRHLPVEDVRAGFAKRFLAGTGVEANGDLVAHGAGGDEKRGFAGENFSSAVFQKMDGGVFPVYVVADFGLGHGGAHGGGGTGDGVAAKINDRGGIGCGGGRVHGQSFQMILLNDYTEVGMEPEGS